ncbi:MAG TPA: methionine adenosyltransferase [Vicinamibacteria bacterium]
MKVLIMEALSVEAVQDRPFELVERKGLGHPDSICDAIVDEAARALSRTYLDTFGAIQHFNLDKGLLAAGSASPRFGGGTVEAPMRFIFGDRAVYEHNGRKVPVGEILESTARRWFAENLRYVDSERQLVIQNEVRPGSPELTGLFELAEPSANDTSVAVGFAPATETEALVMEAERFLNGKSFKERFPESGEDVKVLGVRRTSELDMTVAMAFVDRFVSDEATYFSRKEEMRRLLEEHLRTKSTRLSRLNVHLNTLDQQGRGSAGTYLTVTGTSAEGADSGQVGRGNQLCGWFSPGRPTSNEAVAGKNPVAHVGKVYNFLAQEIATRTAVLTGVREATVYLVSQIGRPLVKPHMVAVTLVLAPDVELEEVGPRVEDIVETTLPRAAGFAREWVLGELASA